MKIDAHQHFWQFDPTRDTWMDEPIRRDFLPEELASVLSKNGFDGCVAVQADQSEKETEFLLKLADSHAFIKGVVGWVDLRSPELPERLAYWNNFEKLKGFRHILQAEPPAFFDDAAFINGLKTLANTRFTYDLLIYAPQLPQAVKLVQQLEELPIVIDHLAKPLIKSGEITAWARHMRQLAAQPNVFCKLSGMVTEADWQHWQLADFTLYLDLIVDAFGPDRLLYGSDWPVCLLAATYEQQLEIVQNYLTANGLEAHANAIFGQNAMRFYHLA